MKIKTKICALTVALALGSGLLAGCNQSGGGSTPTPPEPTKYLVNVPTSDDFTIAGINREGYVKDAKVSFTVTLVNQDKEITAVGYDTTTLTAKASGGYEFSMPEKNVTLFVNTKNVDKYTLSHSGTIQVDGEPVQFVLSLGTDPVTDDFTLEAVEGAEHVSIDGDKVTGVSAGEATIAAKIDGVEKARESITVEKSAYVTIREAIDDAWANDAGFNDNSKSTKSAGQYKIRAKVMFIGNPFTQSGNTICECILDDGTGILVYQIKSDTALTAIHVGDVVEINEKIQNYYGLMETYSSDVKYAKVVDYAVRTTAFTTVESGEAYDTVYNNYIVNDGEHKVQPLILNAKGKKVGDKNRYEVVDATKGLLATSKSVIDLAFEEGVTYTFKGYLLNWNSSSSAQYCNFVAIEQNKQVATAVTIDSEDFELANGTSKTLTYTTTPAGAGQNVAWSVEPTGVVTVVDGVVTAVAEGTATIKLTVDGNEDTVKVTVTNPVPATSAAFSETSIEIKTVDTYDLTKILSSLPKDNSDEAKKTWSVEPAGVVTVEDGVVTPVAPGTATVTVKYNDSVSASISVTVVQQKLSDLAHAKVNDPVDIYAKVVATYPVSGKSGIWVADGDNALTINMAPGEGVVENAIVHVTGVIDAYNGAKQLKNTGKVEVVESHDGIVAPTTLDLNEAAIKALSEVDQARRATVTGVVKSHDGEGTSAHHTLVLTVGEAEIKVYVHKDNCSQATLKAFDDNAKVGRTVTVTGFVSAYQNGCKDFTQVNNSSYQLINPTLDDYAVPTATGIALNMTSAEVEQGKTLQLEASVVPAGATLENEITWSVDAGNDKVEVSTSGLVTVAADAVVDSTATVRATSGTFTATCTVKVIGQTSKTKVEVKTLIGVTAVKNDDSTVVIASNTANGTQFKALNLDENVTASVNTDGNNGKIYDSGKEWRMYQTNNPSIVISVKSGFKLVSVSITYTVSNTGVLKYGDDQIESDAVVGASGSSITFTVGNTASATNGQVKIRGFVIVYDVA